MYCRVGFCCKLIYDRVECRLGQGWPSLLSLARFHGNKQSYCCHGEQLIFRQPIPVSQLMTLMHQLFLLLWSECERISHCICDLRFPNSSTCSFTWTTLRFVTKRCKARFVCTNANSFVTMTTVTLHTMWLLWAISISSLLWAEETFSLICLGRFLFCHKKNCHCKQLPT